MIDHVDDEHPALAIRNPTEGKPWARAWRICRRSHERAQKDRKHLKRKAAKAARRAARQILRGVRPRILKRPGNSWDVA